MRALVAGEEPAAGWLGALGDPRIGGALLVMHQQAARRWTVAEPVAPPAPPVASVAPGPLA